MLEQIAGVRTNAEAAAVMGVTLRTVRTHVLRLVDRTRRRRQVDLVALLASVSAPPAS